MSVLLHPKYRKSLKPITMKSFTFLVFLCIFHISFGQEFSIELFFEDAMGNQDSVILGYDITATDGIDAAFNETNIISVPYTAGLDVRITDELKARGTYPNPISPTYHTKKQIFQKNCPTSFSIQAIDIVTEHWPVTMTWDNSALNDECRNGTVFTCMNPGGWWDVGGFSNFFRVQLAQGSQLTFDDNTYYPQEPVDLFHSYLSDTNTIVSVFWFTFGNESILLDVKDYDTSNVVFYPNPTRDSIKFDLGNANLQIENIELYDMVGKHQKIALQRDHSINLKSLKNGVYFVQIAFTNGQTLLKKIIKE